MQVETRMFAQPLFDFRMGMGPVVIQNQVEFHLPWGLAINPAQELKELLMAVPGVAGADHRAFQDVQGGKQAGGPIARL